MDPVTGKPYSKGALKKMICKQNRKKSKMGEREAHHRTMLLNARRLINVQMNSLLPEPHIELLLPSAMPVVTVGASDAVELVTSLITRPCKYQETRWAG